MGGHGFHAPKEGRDIAEVLEAVGDSFHGVEAFGREFNFRQVGKQKLVIDIDEVFHFLFGQIELLREKTNRQSRPAVLGQFFCDSVDGTAHPFHRRYHAGAMSHKDSVS